MRIEDNVATTAHPWDTAKFLEKIHEIALELQGIRGYVTEYLKDSVLSSYQYHGNTTSDTRVRTSGSPPRKVFGVRLISPLMSPTAH
jgi:hypothetical protein